MTLFCVGLPTLAPLYRRRGFHRSGFQRSGSSHYNERRASSEVRLRDLYRQAEQSTTVFTGDKYGISPVNSEQYVNNHDDEETARASFQVDQNGRMYGNNGIRVKKEVLVKRTWATSVSRDDTGSQGRTVGHVQLPRERAGLHARLRKNHVTLSIKQHTIIRISKYTVDQPYVKHRSCHWPRARDKDIRGHSFRHLD